MSYLDRYKRRMQAQAGRAEGDIDESKSVTLREAQMTRSTESQRRFFFDSPTLKSVVYDGEETYVIQSDKYKSIELQTFLFEPHHPIKAGTLIDDGEHIYLAVDRNKTKTYPELTTRLCNDFFEVPVGYREKVTYDRFGDPIYTQIPTLESVPAVVSDKDYSTVSNAIIPLPAGRINMELPFKAEYLEHFAINFKFDHSAGAYQVTDIQEKRLTPDEKFIKVSATRVPSDGEVSYGE